MPTEIGGVGSFLDIPESSNIIFSIGRLSKEKSFDVCIEAVRLVSEKIPDVCYLIVGDGPEKESLQDLSRRL